MHTSQVSVGRRHTALLTALLGCVALSAPTGVPAAHGAEQANPAATAPAAAAPDARATAVADRLMQGLGGEAAWNDTRYVSFVFFGRRQHVWDKWTGRHRVEGKNREGKSYTILQNVNSRESRVWLDGQELTGDAAKDLIELGYGVWINDTYWLVMPYKLRDPGVKLAYAGEATLGAGDAASGVGAAPTHDKLQLSFEQVGLTPGDRYWAYVNRTTGLMDRWEYILEDMPAEGPATAWDWKDWARYGKVMLAATRVNVGEGRSVTMAPIAVYDTLPDEVFTSPAPWAPPGALAAGSPAAAAPAP